MAKSLSDDERESRMAEDLWLNYLNRYLLEHQVITEREFTLVADKIAARRSIQRMKQDNVS